MSYRNAKFMPNQRLHTSDSAESVLLCLIS